MTTRVHLAEDWMADGVRIFVVQTINGRDHVKRIGLPTGVHTSSDWEPVPQSTDVAPTVFLRDDEARALLAKLQEHFHGGDDTRQLRADYNDERARVDRLIGIVDGVLGRALPS
jgi:hypothetical protein